jgi:glutamate-1-semialdehyde 2,1-aminomutase
MRRANAGAMDLRPGIARHLLLAVAGIAVAEKSKVGYNSAVLSIVEYLEESMTTRDHTRLLADLAQAYTHHAAASGALNDRALQHLIDGGSHTLRLIEPFPPRIASAGGAWVTDEDGHQILDFWQGHLANILGHNPPEVTSVLAQAFQDGFGLQTGFTDALQVETAELLCRQTNAERVRFTSSGTLATMYAILLARAFTGRTLVMKVGGGWHGAQPWALKGIGYHEGDDNGFQRVESAGVPIAVTDKVIVSAFNEPQRLADHFAQYGDQLACFIVEPFLGAGGFVPATSEYLQAARDLTERYGALLIFDEVISAFRFRAGSLGVLHGIQPDLATYGKIVGGGMPVAAVAGRADIMALVGRDTGIKVKFSGGTYSAHPASLLAAKTMMAYLVEHEAEIYPRLAGLGAKTRQAVEDAFRSEGIHACCTGHDDGVLSGSSMFMLHFPYREDACLEGLRDWHNPAVCDVVLRQQVLDLAMLLENVFMLHGHGAVSTAHTEADIDLVADACRRVARRIKPYL